MFAKGSRGIALRKSSVNLRLLRFDLFLQSQVIFVLLNYADSRIGSFQALSCSLDVTSSEKRKAIHLKDVNCHLLISFLQTEDISSAGFLLLFHKLDAPGGSCSCIAKETTLEFAGCLIVKNTWKLRLGMDSLFYTLVNQDFVLFYCCLEMSNLEQGKP